jgi:glycosyltransferase involved in cell wall biosynthesis
MAAELDAYFQTPTDKIDVIPNGVDPSHFLALEGQDLSELRARYARPEEKLVLYVGRLVYEKGIEVLVRAAPLGLAPVPQAKFVIAGKGPELERMRELVRSMGLADKVYLPGFVSDEDRDRLYKLADCAVFPSLYEPFGIVALEAMAAGAPVVGSEVGGLKEVVRHGETGITVYPGDAASCAWGIVHTLVEPQWAEQRVQNAWREVLDRFNWETIARQTADVYTRVVEERLRTDW